MSAVDTYYWYVFDGRYERLKVRCGLEMEGYQTEAKDLRKKLRSLEKIADKRLMRSPIQHQHNQPQTSTTSSPEAVYPWEKAQLTNNATD